LHIPRLVPSGIRVMRAIRRILTERPTGAPPNPANDVGASIDPDVPAKAQDRLCSARLGRSTCGAGEARDKREIATFDGMQKRHPIC
jgi:hypothetical protein